MHVLLIASKLDPCARNMANYLIEHYNFREVEKNNNDFYVGKGIDLLFTAEEALHIEWLDSRFTHECYVFLSRHRSESGIPTLTSHCTGNFSDSTEMGGRARELAYSYPSLQKRYMEHLWQNHDRIKYDVVIEATHHGPTSLSKPLLFVEIGSGEEQWNDYSAISIVCDTLIEAINDQKRSKKIGIALGGTHYPSKFNKLLIDPDSEYAIGHIASKHSLPFIDKSMIEQMMKKSIEDVNCVFLDWKGLGKEKERLCEIINELDIEVIKV